MSKEREFLKTLERGNVSGFFELIDKVDLMHGADEDGQTPAHLAAIHANAIFLRELVKRGAPTNNEDGQGYSPLQAMVLYVLDERLLFNDRYIETTKLLIQNGGSLEELQELRSEDIEDPDLDFIIAQARDILTDETGTNSTETDPFSNPHGLATTLETGQGHPMEFAPVYGGGSGFGEA